MSKRTLHDFVGRKLAPTPFERASSPPAKRTRIVDLTADSDDGEDVFEDVFEDASSAPASASTSSSRAGPAAGEAHDSHETYPWALPHLPVPLQRAIESAAADENVRLARAITDAPHLDLLSFKPFLARSAANELFHWLRSELFWYRVEYKTRKFGEEKLIKTPRFTTVFGLDITSHFDEHGVPVDNKTGQSAVSKYDRPPRPIPRALDELRRAVEHATGTPVSFTHVLCNYYADGQDSISYHSDDERFLGARPTIASLSLGASRDFLMKHKPTLKQGGSPPKPRLDAPEERIPRKFSLASGDMIVMRGDTQSNWLHSIPKRAGASANEGRINITFRRALVPGGTRNYYQYNTGDGPPHRWDATTHKMLVAAKK